MNRFNRYAALLGVLTMILMFVFFFLSVGLGPQAMAGADTWAYLPVLVNDDGEAQATATPGPQPTMTPTPRPTLSGDAIVVDSRNVDSFDQIPEQYIQAAANLRMLFIDRSVGQNISEGLTCLTASSDEESSNSSCWARDHYYPEFEVDPSVISWSRPGGYDRSNWDYRTWSQGCGGWERKVPCFADMVSPLMNQYDVLSYQFSYLDVLPGSTIADQPGGFFWDNADRDDIHEFEQYVAQYPNKTFIYWTTSLARSIGNEPSQLFNEQMRNYAIQNEKILFDVADILSHDPDGNPCYDNRDGIPYANSHDSENYPDDGHNYPAICPHYTTETDGGHLGSVAAGKIRVAKGFWVLMARIAGWDGQTP